MAEQQSQAGTAETNPQGGGNAGTGEGTGAGGGNTGTASGATQGSEDATNLKAENQRLKQELLANKTHIEEANRIRAFAEQAAEEAARTPPTRAADEGNYAQRITAADIEEAKVWANSNDAATARAGKMILAGVESGVRGELRAQRVEKLLGIPDSERTLVMKKLEANPNMSVESAREQVKGEKADTLGQENAALKAKIAELEAGRTKEVTAGTHMRDAPPQTIPDEPVELTVAQLSQLYRGSAADVKKARNFEAREAQKKARLIP
jgi:hypothetical protein